MTRANGVDIEIDVKRERLEKDEEGGFQGCNAIGHASWAIDEERDPRLCTL